MEDRPLCSKHPSRTPSPGSDERHQKRQQILTWKMGSPSSFNLTFVMAAWSATWAGWKGGVKAVCYLSRFERKTWGRLKGDDVWKEIQNVDLTKMLSFVCFVCVHRMMESWFVWRRNSHLNNELRLSPPPEDLCLCETNWEGTRLY